MVVKNRGTAAPHVDPGRRSARGELPPLEAALLAAGFARSPAEARVLARSLLAAVRAAGVSVPHDSSARDVICAFQGLHGLPVTGLLDDATTQKLLDTGLLRRPEGSPPPRPQARPISADAGGTRAAPGPQAPREAEFVLGGRPSLIDVGLSTPTKGREGHGDAGDARTGEPAFVLQHEQMRARVELHRDPAPRDLTGLLENLALQGFLGAGRGAQRLESALRAFQTQQGLPPTGKLDQATVVALVERGALPPGTETWLTNTVGPSHQLAAAEKAAGGTSPPLTREERPLPSFAEHGPSPGDGQLGSAYIAPSADGRNAPAGDDDTRDPRRGHATLKDDVDVEESYYEMPSLGAQLHRALDELVSDDGSRGVPTYSWDVTLYQPGVYGRRQPAEAVLHVVVQRAASLDPVWREARDALATRLVELEPTSCPPSDDDFTNALRRARARAVSHR